MPGRSPLPFTIRVLTSWQWTRPGWVGAARNSMTGVRIFAAAIFSIGKPNYDPANPVVVGTLKIKSQRQLRRPLFFTWVSRAWQNDPRSSSRRKGRVPAAAPGQITIDPVRSNVTQVRLLKGRVAMSENDITEQRIREVAYFLWEADDKPEGSADRYWERGRKHIFEASKFRGDPRGTHDRRIRPEPIKAVRPPGPPVAGVMHATHVGRGRYS